MQEACSRLVHRWCACEEDDLTSFTTDDLKTFIPEQIDEFCALLLEKVPLPVAKLKYMNDLYNMDSYRNNEIRFRWVFEILFFKCSRIDVNKNLRPSWFRICIQSRWKEPVDSALNFATDQGRMKYVRPIFRYCTQLRFVFLKTRV